MNERKKRKPKLPDPFEPLNPRKYNKHRKFLELLEMNFPVNDFLVGSSIAKDLQVVYGLADELNKLKVGEPMEWVYWPSKFDADGAVVLEPKGPYTLKVERITETTPLKEFKRPRNSNFGWVWDPKRKQFVWQLTS